MNKYDVKLSFFLLLALLCLLTAYQKQVTKETITSSSTIASSNQASQSYTTISLAELQEKMATDEDFFLYVGRPTCPYCEIFLPKLEEAIQETGTPVYYLNTDLESDTTAINSFLVGQQVQTVPHLAYYHGQEKVTYLEKGSEASSEEIKQFLQQH